MVERVAGTRISEPTGQFASATASEMVTPDDATPLQFKALYVGGAGDIAIKHSSDGPTITYIGVQAGILPVAGVRVMAATNGSDIVAMNW